ncbi:MAG: hypothetical protein AB8B57_06050 [Congregibacter sp.]
MLTINKLEKIIELEENLRAEYQDKLDTANAEIERYKREQIEYGEKRKQLQASLDQQLETIQELSSKATTIQKVEQRNRELFNRSENLQGEIATLKQRVKTLQKDLAKEREQIKELTQYDPIRMRSNLDASKKKLAEKAQANELLQKSLKEARGEKAALQLELDEVKAKLPATEEDSGSAEESGREEKAA